MKKIIFDLDDTLMMFNDSYIKDYCEIINGTFEEGINLYKAIGKYEQIADLYDKNDMLDFINNDQGTNYTMENLNDLEKIIATKWFKYVPDGTRDVLEYLYNRYELYVLTNWFSDNQKDRLKNAGFFLFALFTVSRNLRYGVVSDYNWIYLRLFGRSTAHFKLAGRHNLGGHLPLYFLSNQIVWRCGLTNLFFDYRCLRMVLLEPKPP